MNIFVTILKIFKYVSSGYILYVICFPHLFKEFRHQKTTHWKEKDTLVCGTKNGGSTTVDKSAKKQFFSVTCLGI